VAEIRKNERFVPLKNYIIAVLVIAAIIGLAFYGFAWYKVIKENRISTSYLVKNKVITKEIDNINELADVFSEAPSSYFIYISYTGNEKIYSLEKDLSKTIKDYNLNDSFYYLNINNIKDNENYIDEINKALNLEEKKVKKVPTIIYYNDGKPVDIINKEDNNMMNVGDFQKLLDANKVTKDQ
jgi:hypothetical protein